MAQARTEQTLSKEGKTRPNTFINAILNTKKKDLKIRNPRQSPNETRPRKNPDARNSIQFLFLCVGCRPEVALEIGHEETGSVFEKNNGRQATGAGAGRARQSRSTSRETGCRPSCHFSRHETSLFAGGLYINAVAIWRVVCQPYPVAQVHQLVEAEPADNDVRSVERSADSQPMALLASRVLRHIQHFAQLHDRERRTSQWASSPLSMQLCVEPTRSNWFHQICGSTIQYKCTTSSLGVFYRVLSRIRNVAKSRHVARLVTVCSKVADAPTVGWFAANGKPASYQSPAGTGRWRVNEVLIDLQISWNRRFTRVVLF